MDDLYLSNITKLKKQSLGKVGYKLIFIHLFLVFCDKHV
jgi:hypothetical protein